MQAQHRGQHQPMGPMLRKMGSRAGVTQLDRPGSASGVQTVYLQTPFGQQGDLEVPSTFLGSQLAAGLEPAGLLVVSPLFRQLETHVKRDLSPASIPFAGHPPTLPVTIRTPMRWPLLPLTHPEQGRDGPSSGASGGGQEPEDLHREQQPLPSQLSPLSKFQFSAVPASVSTCVLPCACRLKWLLESSGGTLSIVPPLSCAWEPRWTGTAEPHTMQDGMGRGLLRTRIAGSPVGS